MDEVKYVFQRCALYTVDPTIIHGDGIAYQEATLVGVYEDRESFLAAFHAVRGDGFFTWPVEKNACPAKMFVTPRK